MQVSATPINEVCFKDRGPSVETMWLNKTKKNPLSWWKTHFAKKMPVGMKVGKCRMQYMHDTINGKIKASQGVEYINYGHNYTVTIKMH